MSTDYDATELHAAADRHVLTPMLRDRRMIYTRGEGCRLWDAEGNEYLDAISGTNGVALVGHSPPRVAEAVAQQFTSCRRTSSTRRARRRSSSRAASARPHRPAVEDVPLPGWRRGGGGGAQARDAHHGQGESSRCTVATTAPGSAASGCSVCRGARLVPGRIRWPTFQQVPSADPYRPTVGEGDDWRPAARALEAAIDTGTYNNVAAVILELVQGPGGHVAFPREYVQEVRAHHRCARHPADRRRGADRPRPLRRHVVQ